jgi:hypothetical protein
LVDLNGLNHAQVGQVDDGPGVLGLAWWKEGSDVVGVRSPTIRVVGTLGS